MNPKRCPLCNTLITTSFVNKRLSYHLYRSHSLDSDQDDDLDCTKAGTVYGPAADFVSYQPRKYEITDD